MVMMLSAILLLGMSMVVVAAKPIDLSSSLVIDCDGPEKYQSNVSHTLDVCCSSYPHALPKRVTLLAGNWFVTTPPLLLPCDNLELHFASSESRLAVIPNTPADWPASATFAVGAIGRTNVSITGTGVSGHGGTIDGRGTPSGWWRDCTLKRPFLVMFVNCRHVRVHNVTLTNSPMFHLVGMNTSHVHIDHIHIQAPYTDKSCNLDGIDFMNSSSILIERSTIHSGDDNIAIKENCHHVLIRNCLFGTGHGASIGSIRHGHTYNVTFESLRLDGPDNGCRIKTWKDGSGSVHDITFKNISMINTAHPIIIDTDYHDGPQPPSMHDTASSSSAVTAAPPSAAAPPTHGVPIYRVVFHDIFAGRSRSPARIQCQPDVPCTDITVSNIALDVAIKCAYVSGKSIAPLSPSSLASCITPADASGD